jgi:hypothetical protein
MDEVRRFARWTLLGLVALGGCAVCLLAAGSKKAPAENHAQDAGPTPEKKAKVAKRKKPTPPVDDGANKARAEECRVKLEELRGLSVLYQLQWKSGHVIPKALVGPTFYSLPIDGKQAFADTINCYLLQGAPEYIEIEMLDWRTGKRVARYSWGKLKME